MVKILTIFKSIVFILALFGIIILGNVTHELVHYYDIKKMNGTIEEICFFTLPLEEGHGGVFNSPAGYVVHSGNVFSSELKAYILSSILILIFVVISFIVLFYEVVYD